jgi:predicted PurR-regulated permease PerM
MATTFQFPSNRATRLGINILILLAAGIALRLCQSVFVPLIIAILLACVLAPAAVWLNRSLNVRWTLACITAVFGVIVLTVLISLVLFVSVSGLVGELDPSKLAKTMDTFLRKFNDVSPFPVPERNEDEAAEPKDAADGKAHAARPPRFGPTEDQIRQFTRDKTPALLEQAGRLALEWLFLWFLILFLLFFLLLEGPTLARRLVNIFGPSEELKAKANEVLGETADQIRTYIVWRTIINFGLAIVIGMAFQLGGLRQAWAWAVMLAILNYIPYLGPFLAALPPFVDGFVHCSSFWVFFILCVIYWGVIIMEGYLIVPLVMGRTMDLNASTVILACLFWELVWGATGLFLAMPIMAGVKSICTHVPGWWQWANLMSSQEVVAPPEPGTPIAQETKSSPDMRLAGDGSPKGAVGAADARQPATK